MRVICIDIETTGFEKEDEILQFAMISNAGDMFSELYRPVIKQEWEIAEAINGISPEKVRAKYPFNYEENIRFIQSMVNSADVVIGYNHEFFDIPFLEKYGIDFTAMKSYDVMKHFKEYYNRECGGIKPRYKLSFAAEHFGISFNAHDALEDVKATFRIYEKLIEKRF